MRFVLVFFLLAHGVAHLVGFVSSWKLATLAELPYKTTVLSSRIDVGPHCVTTRPNRLARSPHYTPRRLMNVRCLHDNC